MFAPDDQLPYWLGVLTPSAVGGTRAIATSLTGRIAWLPATSIRLSQTSVNEAAQLTSSMKANGWLDAPIDAVRMPDGLITAVDNTRVVAAHHAGIAVKVSVHAFDESLSPAVVARFTTRKGGRADNDDVACFDLDNVRVSVIHDFADSGWEERASFPDFASWLHAAIDEMLRFE
jgi:hypothetical protein